MRNYSPNEAVKKFSIVAYDESLPQSISDIFSSLVSLGCIQYAYIKHDNDVDINGLPKKCHYHIYLMFENKKSYHYIAKMFGIAPNDELLKPVKSVNGLIRYFIHLDDKDKYQYCPSDIIAYNIDINQCFEPCFDKESINEAQLTMILSFIYSGQRNLNAIFSYVLENHLLATFQKYYYIIRDVIREVK